MTFWIFISHCSSPSTPAFSRAACGIEAVARTNSPEQTPDRFSVVFDHAHRRYAPARSRNARPRAPWGRLHRDNRKRGATVRTIPARDDRARCKSQSTQQNRRQSGYADNCGEFRRTDFSGQLPRAYADRFCDSARSKFQPQKTDRVFRQTDFSDVARLWQWFERTQLAPCTTRRSALCHRIFVSEEELPLCFPFSDKT